MGKKTTQNVPEDIEYHKHCDNIKCIRILDFFIKSISTDITDVAPLKDFSWMTHSEESCQASIFNQQLSLKETN